MDRIFKEPFKSFAKAYIEQRKKIVQTCPYRGLFVFREQDEKFFFGRESYVKEIYEVLQNKSLITLVGASGSGKSSIIYAGLIPRLRRQIPGEITKMDPSIPQDDQKGEKWIIIPFRPNERPFYTLLSEIIPVWQPELSRGERLIEINKVNKNIIQTQLSLRDVFEDLSKKYPESHLLLFADQFEELYTLCQGNDERHRFLNELFGILGMQNLACILSIRADFLGKALSYRPFADVFQGTDIILGPMNSEELRTVIEEPAKLLDIEIEDGLIE